MGLKKMGLRVMGSGLHKSRRNHHIQIYVRRELASKPERLQSEINYCYQCFEWVVGEQ